MMRNKVYLVIQTVLCVVVAALLCMSVIVLYREGVALRENSSALTWIFTPERVAGRFARIALPFFGSIGFMIAGLVLGIKSSSAQAPVYDVECTRDFLAARTDELTPEVLKERRLQKGLLAGGWILFGLCMIPVLLYVVDPGHFPSDDLELMFSSLLLGILPWIALGLGCLVLCFAVRGRSVGREVELLRECTVPSAAEVAPAGMEKQSRSDGLNARRRDRLVVWVRILVLVAAVVMIVAGVLNGSLRDVLVKAINLCTECVGLG